MALPRFAGSGYPLQFFAPLRFAALHKKFRFYPLRSPAYRPRLQAGAFNPTQARNKTVILRDKSPHGHDTA
jgi:hypothetical protein